MPSILNLINPLSIIGGEFKYDSEWNHLMPVAEKIKNIGTTSDTTDVEYKLLDNLDDALICVRMDLVYSSCIEFIQYYNEKNQKDD